LRGTQDEKYFDVEILKNQSDNKDKEGGVDYEKLNSLGSVQYYEELGSF
jgi:hypothetical protein